MSMPVRAAEEPSDDPVDSGPPSYSSRPSFADRPRETARETTTQRETTAPPRFGLFTLALLVVMYAARRLLIPLVFALMLYFLLRPSMRALVTMRLPRALAAALVLLCVLGALSFTGVELATPASTWIERLPVAVRQLEFKSQVLKAPVERVSALAQKIERVAEMEGAEGAQKVALVQPRLMDALLDASLEFVVQLLTMLVAAFFLLLCGDGFLAQLFRLVPDLGRRERATAIIGSVEQFMSRYLLTITLLNLCLGSVLTSILYFLGMPSPLLWGGLAAIAAFVPYIGAAFGITTVAIAALVSFDTLASALLPPLAYLALTMVQGNLIAPLILGWAFRMSPLVVFLWVLFWGWMWSVAGAILAVPLLMLVNVVCKQSKDLRAIPEMIEARA